MYGISPYLSPALRLRRRARPKLQGSLDPEVKEHSKSPSKGRIKRPSDELEAIRRQLERMPQLALANILETKQLQRSPLKRGLHP